MSNFPIFNEVELIKYYARKISTFCKEHRCAACPLSTNGSCNLLRDVPDQWKGIDTVKVEVTEVHTFAKPDDVSDIKFGD